VSFCVFLSASRIHVRLPVFVRGEHWFSSDNSRNGIGRLGRVYCYHIKISATLLFSCLANERIHKMVQHGYVQQRKALCAP
jgi:hypothetical protein